MFGKWNWFRRREFKCPDGSIRIIEDIDIAFPLFIKGVSVDASAGVRGADTIDANVSTQYKEDIKGFLFELNKQNQSLMMGFRAVYSVYKTDPCGSVSYLQNGVDRLLDEQRKISELQMKITALITLATQNPNDSARAIAIYDSIAGLLGGPAIAPAASLEMQEAREAAQSLLGR